MVEIIPASIWSFAFTSVVAGPFLFNLFSAVLGVFGMNYILAPPDDKKKYVRLITGLIVVAVLLSSWTAYENARQMQQTDVDKRIAEAQKKEDQKILKNATDTLKSISAQSQDISTQNREISGQNQSMNDQIKRLADAAHVSSGKSTAEVVQSIIDKLPKGTVKAEANGTGSNATANQTGPVTNGSGILTIGQTGGTNTITVQGQKRSTREIYVDGESVGKLCGNVTSNGGIPETYNFSCVAFIGSLAPTTDLEFKNFRLKCDSFQSRAFGIDAGEQITNCQVIGNL
jgi:hypothetical protein